MEPQNAGDSGTLEPEEIGLAEWAAIVAVVGLGWCLYLWIVLALSDYLPA